MVDKDIIAVTAVVLCLKNRSVLCRIYIRPIGCGNIRPEMEVTLAPEDPPAVAGSDRAIVAVKRPEICAGLLRLLLSDPDTRARFFTEADGILVFDKVGFGWAVSNRAFLPDSYTRFQNKIGLADSSGQLLSASGGVTLVFPYKDCVLEGGQTREDQRRGEIFYNETLAPHEIDRLLAPKVLVHPLRCAPEGEAPAAEIHHSAMRWGWLKPATLP